MGNIREGMVDIGCLSGIGSLIYLPVEGFFPPFFALVFTIFMAIAGIYFLGHLIYTAITLMNVKAETQTQADSSSQKTSPNAD